MTEGTGSADRQAAVWTTGILLACLAYGASGFPLVFDTNDDAAMLGISLGLFSDGLGDPRLVYQSAFLGALIGALFRLLPGFDAYSAFQWLVCSSAFATMLFVVLRRDRSLLGILSVAAAASIYLVPILFRMQFTQTSLICVAASAVLLLDRGRSAMPSRSALIGAMGFAVLATLIRSVNLMAAQLILLAVMAHVALRWRIEGNRSAAWRSMALGIGFVAVLTATSFALRGAEEAIFYADPAWNAFWNQHADRAFVLDNWPRSIGLPRIVSALQQELGITPHQFLALMHWLPVHEDLYSVERFSEMAQVIRGLDSGTAFDPTRWATSFTELGAWIRSNPIFGGSLALIGLISLLRALETPRLAWMALATGAFWIAIACGLVLGISLSFRVPPYRVWMPITALCVMASIACHADLRARARATAGVPEDLHPFGGRRSIGVGVAFAVGLVWLVPLHQEVRALVHADSVNREARCALTTAHVQAFSRLPDEAKIFIAPRVIHTECYLAPFRNEYPEILRDRAISFGWRNLTPWVREVVFAEHDNLFESICADPANMFVLHPADWADVDKYLRRHEPGITLVAYAPDLPPAIRSCRRETFSASNEAPGGASDAGSVQASGEVAAERTLGAR